MAIIPGNSNSCLRMLVVLPALFVSLGAKAAHLASMGNPSPYCQQNYGSIISPPARSDNRYTLLLMFDVSGKDAVNGFFHTVPAEDTRTPAQEGCISDPETRMSDPKEKTAAAGGKPIGIIVQGSCPTDCVPPHVHRKAEPGKKASSKEDPLGEDKWGVFSADGSDSKILVWQILAGDATHAALILASLKQDSSFPANAYLGNLLIGHFEPRSSRIGTRIVPKKSADPHP